MSRGRDRLNELPDCLLSNQILGRLPLKDAARCAVLSTRWKCLWNLSPNLKFDWEFRKHKRSSKVHRLIDDILSSHCVQLENFELDLNNRARMHCCKPDKISQWIDCAASKSVKRIAITGNRYCKCYLHPFEVPAPLFSCNFLENLDLYSFKLTNFPTGFDGFKRLITCRLEHIQLTNKTLQQLVALCPCLETLNLSSCTGFANLEIYSSSPSCLKKLIINYCEGLAAIKISSSSLHSLEVLGHSTPLLSLTVICPLFQDLSLYLGPAHEQLSQGVEINAPMFQNLSVQLPFLKIFSSLKQLRKITVFSNEVYGVPNKLSCISVLNSFPNMEELNTCTRCLKDMTTPKDISDLSFPLKKLKKVHVNVSTFGAKEISLLGCLLRKSPVLATMTIVMPSCDDENHYSKFKKQVFRLRCPSAGTSFLITKSSTKCSKCLNPRTTLVLPKVQPSAANV